MKTWLAGLAAGYALALAADALAQTPEKASPAAKIPLRPFDPQSIGIELKLQGEYVGKDGEKRVGVQVAARGGQSFHALVLEGGLQEARPCDKLEVNGPTPHAFRCPETPDGPIWFEAFGRRVFYRSIWLVERQKKGFSSGVKDIGNRGRQ